LDQNNNLTLSQIHNILQSLGKYTNVPIVQKILKEAFDPAPEDQKQDEYTNPNLPNINKKELDYV